MKEYNGTPINPETARAEIEYLLKFGRDAQKASEEGNKPTTFQFGSEEWLYVNGHVQRYKPADPDHEVKPDTFCAFSLDGLIDFIKTDVDGFFKNEEFKCIVQVSSPTEVNVFTPIFGYWKERHLLARCQATVPTIRFGTWMDPEDFQIMMLSTFLTDENRDAVVKLAGSIRQEQKIERADDGVSQRVTVNQGVATAANVTVKNPVYLTPMRTFPEVEQPESPFVLRFNNDANVALFSGDGGAWKLQAVARITEYLRNNLMGCNVVVIG